MIWRADGCLLLARRPAGSHLAGKWEFPGGKCHDGESLEACIRREIREELGLEVQADERLATIEHVYPEKTVRLHFMACELRNGAAICHHDGQDSGWFRVEQLAGLDLAGADRQFADHLPAFELPALLTTEDTENGRTGEH